MYKRLSSFHLQFTLNIGFTVFWPFLVDFGQNIVTTVVLKIVGTVVLRDVKVKKVTVWGYYASIAKKENND
jgi:hypothetical protein